MVAFAALAVLGLVAPASAADAVTTETRFVQAINELRGTKGLQPLVVDEGLVAVARRWAAKMASVDRISHNPNLATDVTADWEKLGENVGVGMTVPKLHRAFVASPSHYRNLVDTQFTHIGVGVVFGRGGAIFTAHQFMVLRPAPAPAAVVVAPPPAPLAVEPSARLHAVLAGLSALDAA